MILGRNLLTSLGMDLKFSENIVIGGEVPYIGLLSAIGDVSN